RWAMVSPSNDDLDPREEKPQGDDPRLPQVPPEQIKQDDALPVDRDAIRSFVQRLFDHERWQPPGDESRRVLKQLSKSDTWRNAFCEEMCAEEARRRSSKPSRSE